MIADDMICNAVITANGISTHRNTVTTTISISVVQFASRSFLHSFFRFSRNNIFRLSWACFIARNSNTFSVTNAAHGTRWTNNIRNRKQELKYKSSPMYSLTQSAVVILQTVVVSLCQSIDTNEYDLKIDEINGEKKKTTHKNINRNQ